MVAAVRDDRGRNLAAHSGVGQPASARFPGQARAVPVQSSRKARPPAVNASPRTGRSYRLMWTPSNWRLRFAAN